MVELVKMITKYTELKIILRIVVYILTFAYSKSLKHHNTFSVVSVMLLTAAALSKPQHVLTVKMCVHCLSKGCGQGSVPSVFCHG